MKKILSILTALVLCLSICLCIPASGDAERLFDNATLLSSEEADELLAKLDEVSKNHGVDIVVVTVNSTGDKSAKEYAGDFYDYNGYNQNGGIIMVVSMGDRKWHILPVAQSIYVYTNAGLEVMADKVTPLLSDGEYFDCFMTFADLCDNYYTKYETDGKGYDNGDLPKDDFNGDLQSADRPGDRLCYRPCHRFGHEEQAKVGQNAEFCRRLCCPRQLAHNRAERHLPLYECCFHSEAGRQRFGQQQLLLGGRQRRNRRKLLKLLSKTEESFAKKTFLTACF